MAQAIVKPKSGLLLRAARAYAERLAWPVVPVHRLHRSGSVKAF